jgi:D-alanyl-D-alanine-carboxypeptidase/D-alanyl-D-alanine-endopeptidase
MKEAYAIPSGTYEGRLGLLPIRFNLTYQDGGQPTVTIDSPNQGGFDIPCEQAFINERSLRFWSRRLKPRGLEHSATTT